MPAGAIGERVEVGHGGDLGEAGERQPDVVLGEVRRRRRRRRHEVQLGALQLLLERVVAEAVQHRRHAVREVLGPPHPPQARRRVVGEALGPAGRRASSMTSAITVASAIARFMPLAPGRRDDVGGVAGEQQVAVAHRRDTELCIAGDAAVDDRPGVQP